MAIQRATAEQAGEAVAILGVLYHRSPATVERMAAILSNKDFVLLVASDEEAPMGFLHAELLDRLDGELMMLVYDLEVTAEYRRQGVATELMQAALDVAHEQGAARCWLLTETDNR